MIYLSKWSVSIATLNYRGKANQDSYLLLDIFRDFPSVYPLWTSVLDSKWPSTAPSPLLLVSGAVVLLPSNRPVEREALRVPRASGKNSFHPLVNHHFPHESGLNLPFLRVNIIHFIHWLVISSSFSVWKWLKMFKWPFEGIPPIFGSMFGEQLLSQKFASVRWLAGGQERGFLFVKGNGNGTAEELREHLHQA